MKANEGRSPQGPRGAERSAEPCSTATGPSRFGRSAAPRPGTKPRAAAASDLASQMGDEGSVQRPKAGKAGPGGRAEASMQGVTAARLARPCRVGTRPVERVSVLPRSGIRERAGGVGEPQPSPDRKRGREWQGVAQGHVAGCPRAKPGESGAGPALLLTRRSRGPCSRRAAKTPGLWLGGWCAAVWWGLATCVNL